MYQHTFKITLSNGDKGELSLSMPSSADAPEWEQRVSSGDVGGRVNALAVRSWTIAAQSGARACATIEAAQEYADSYRSGERASPIAKVVRIDGTALGLSEEQADVLRSQGVVVTFNA